MAAIGADRDNLIIGSKFRLFLRLAEDISFYMNWNKIIKFFIFCFILFVLAGCQTPSAADGLKILNDSLGKALNSFGENQASSTYNFFAAKDNKKTAADLSPAEKKAIDDWLEKKGLNKYGDAPNAVYTGGTPLFDEKTGRAIERYDYILNKFPDIFDLIKQGK
jgi:hypothetical protein